MHLTNRMLPRLHAGNETKFMKLKVHYDGGAITNSTVMRMTVSVMRMTILEITDVFIVISIGNLSKAGHVSHEHKILKFL